MAQKIEKEKQTLSDIEKKIADLKYQRYLLLLNALIHGKRN